MSKKKKRHEWPSQDKKSRKQRGKKGWCPSDVWNLDSYLNILISQTLRHLAETTHGWPQGEEWPKFEDWLRDIQEVASRFETMNDDDWQFPVINGKITLREDMQKYTDETFRRLGQMWLGLWD